MTLTLVDALGPVMDAFLLQFYFSTANDEKEISTARKATAMIFPLLMVFLAFRGMGIHMLPRFLFRVVCYGLYLYFAKGIWSVRGLFVASFAASCSTASLNIFMSPLMDTAMTFFGLPQDSPWMQLLLTSVIRVLIILLLYYFLPVDYIEQPTLSGWFPLGMTVLCILLTREIRWNGQDLSESGGVIFILLQVFMLLFLVVFERENHRARLEKESRIQNAVNEERLKVYEYQYKADADFRQLRHDMKNHLLAIRTLMGEEKDEKLKDYLDNLLDRASNEPVAVETGNHTLDGLLSQKASVLRLSSIRFDTILDFRGIDFISNMDLCTIFGNAVDNAIEACRKVENVERRYISIHSEKSAGQLIISFINSYQGQIQMRNGLPVTSKKDPHWHGLGLSSIYKTVRKYGGVAQMDLSVPEQFSLTILIPLPENNT